MIVIFDCQCFHSPFSFSESTDKRVKPKSLIRLQPPDKTKLENARQLRYNGWLFWWLFERYLQLFRQSLSHKSVKAYATMPISIMGRKRLALIDWGWRCLPTRKDKAQIHLFGLFPSMSLKHLKSQSKTMNPLTHNTFRHCRVGFCWTTFLETAVYRIFYDNCRNSRALIG